MIQTEARFTWTSLTLSWLAERTDTSLSVPAALRRAQDDLEERGATVELTRDPDCLRFSAPWFSRRSWLGIVAGGCVRIERDSAGIRVTVQASFWPLLLYSLGLGGLLVLSGFSLVLVIMLVVFPTSFAIAAYNDLRGAARAALTLNPP